MHNTPCSGLGLIRRSKYYIDPTVSHGHVVIKKAADPEKLREYRKLKGEGRNRRDRLTPREIKKLNPDQLRRMAAYIHE